ncbi:MAG: hypothetical protein KDD55_05165 [Bdellovibrionales bacterium]|nr:hypothetical protein [Bdellovibrionales bacterium]
MRRTFDTVSVFWGAFSAAFFCAIALLYRDLVFSPRTTLHFSLGICFSCLFIVALVSIFYCRSHYRLKPYTFLVSSSLSLLLAFAFSLAFVFHASPYLVLLFVPVAWMIVLSLIKKYSVLSGKHLLLLSHIRKYILIFFLLSSILLALLYSMGPYALFGESPFSRALGGWFVPLHNRFLFTSFSMFFLLVAALFASHGTLSHMMAWCSVVLFLFLGLSTFLGAKNYLMGYTTFGIALEHHIPHEETLFVVNDEGQERLEALLSQYRAPLSHVSLEDGFPIKNGYVLLRESDLERSLSQRTLPIGSFRRITSLFDLPHVVWKYNDDNVVLIHVSFIQVLENVV